jgi:O-antigen ligase
MKPSTRLDRLRDLNALPAALRWAVILYLAHILLQGKIALSQISAWLAVVFLAWAIYRKQIAPSFHILYFPLAVYGLASTVSSFVMPHEGRAAGEIMLWVKMLVFPAALILFRGIPWTREVALKAQIVFAVAIASYGLFQFFALDRRHLDNRITGPVTHVLTYSGLLLPLSLLLLVLAMHRRKPGYVIATAIVSLALLLTFTRSVWIAWAAAVFVMLVLKRFRWVPIAAGVLLLFLALMPMDLFSRLSSIFDVEQASNLDRIQMAESGVEMIKDYPLLGVGPANVKELYPLYREQHYIRFRPPHLHNNIIQIWAERGVVALAAYLLLLALFLRECARGWRGPAREFAQAGVLIATSLTVAGFFEFNFGDTEVFYLTLGLFALVIASLEAVQPATNELPDSLVATGPAAIPARP